MEVGGEGRSHALAGGTAVAGPRSALRRADARWQRLGARKIASTTAPVIFENRLATSLIGPLIGAIAGPAIARGASFLKDKLGQKLSSRKPSS